MKVERAQARSDGLFVGPPGMNIGNQGKFAFRLLDREKGDIWTVWWGLPGREGEIAGWMIDDLIERLKKVKELIKK